MDESELLPDVKKILSFLKMANQCIALGSASKNARYIIEKVNVKAMFDAVVDGTDVSKAKPDPEVFLIAAKLIGRAPEDCIVFEDSVAGVQAANRANMVSIGIGSAEVLSEADYIFNDFTEISEEFINTLINN